jgi:hypothetical protein
MSKVVIAERILEMVTTFSRASSVVGDLLEEAPNCSALWFWFSVLQICASHIWREFSYHWRQIVLRILWAFFELLVLMLLFNFGFVIIGTIAAFILYPFGLNLWALKAPGIDAWIPVLLRTLAIPFLLGWRVAKHSDGHELASSITFVFIGIALSFAFQLHIVSQGLLLFGAACLRAAFSIFASSLPIIAGAALFRYRANTHYRKQLLEIS